MVKKERNQEIDIMKGLLTLAMILCHCLQFFGKEDAGIEKILVNVINLTTFSGFLFCLLDVQKPQKVFGTLKKCPEASL